MPSFTFREAFPLPQIVFEKSHVQRSPTPSMQKIAFLVPTGTVTLFTKAWYSMLPLPASSTHYLDKLPVPSAGTRFPPAHSPVIDLWC